MIRLNPLRRQLSESDLLSNDIKDALNENQVIRVEQIHTNIGELNMLVLHLSNGKSIKIGGFSEEDVIYAEISI